MHSLQPAVLGSYDRCVGTSLSPSAIDQSVVTDTPSTGGGPDFALDTLVLTLLAPQTHINVARFDPVMPLALPLMHLLQLGRTPNVLDVTVTYCESQVAPSALALSERLLSAFAASGTTSTAATGDRGSSGCYPQTPPSVTDPASSRFVVAIGGASFSGSAESPHDLLAWNRPRQFGGGGGASRAVMAPPWQSATKTELPDLSTFTVPGGGVCWYRTTYRGSWPCSPTPRTSSRPLDSQSMPKQQRTMRIEQRSQLAAMQQLESRSDEELEAETRFKAAAQAILGARAAERYDAKAARAHFQRALAAARPQERMQLRRMADASLALAERRPDDLKKATERLGVEAPSSRQLRGLRLMGLLAPPASAGILVRIRGIVLIIVLVVAILALGFGIVKLISLPFGGVSLDLNIFYGLVLVAVAVGILAYFGRRRQKRAQAERAEQAAARAR